jgi:hypothetical protein
MAKLSIRDIELTNKRLFIRVDFNVPLTEDGAMITDDTRIVATLPTIEYALRKNAKVILASHLGRPKGKPNPKYSLKPVVTRLRELLDKKLGEGINVAFSPDCVGEIAEEMARQLESGQVLLLENLRFHAEEEANDPAFSNALAALAEVYVNDAFGSAHRAHASTEGITHYLKPAVAGLLMEKEITYLGKALENPEKPFVAIIGGSKISGKIDVIQTHESCRKTKSSLPFEELAQLIREGAPRAQIDHRRGSEEEWETLLLQRDDVEVALIERNPVRMVRSARMRSPNSSRTLQDCKPESGVQWLAELSGLCQNDLRISAPARSGNGRRQQRAPRAALGTLGARRSHHSGRQRRLHQRRRLPHCLAVF